MSGIREPHNLGQTWKELEDQEEHIVCGGCIQDSFLRSHCMSNLHVPRVCVGCAATVEQAVTLKKLAELCGSVLGKHFELNQGHFPGYELSLADIVGQALACGERKVLELVATLLEAPIDDDEESEREPDHFYAVGQEYQRMDSPFDDEEHERWYVLGDWHYVATQLTHGRRFFNEGARELFDGILREALAAEDVHLAGLRPIVRTVPVDFEFFRARVAKNFDEQQQFLRAPAGQLGAPPKDRAANNRMSPAGIPLLYAAEDERTCVAEVRPSIGDRVVIGKFRSTRPLKIFDMTALSGRLVHQPLSFFDPSFENRTQRRTLLEHLHSEISRPVKTHDTDYLMTQALTEFIRFNCDEKFDGVAFKSVQSAGGINYVLFDSTSEQERLAPDWSPKFDLEIDPSAVWVVEVSAMEYSTITVPSSLSA